MSINLCFLNVLIAGSTGSHNIDLTQSGPLVFSLPSARNTGMHHHAQSQSLFQCTPGVGPAQHSRDWTVVSVCACLNKCFHSLSYLASPICYLLTSHTFTLVPFKKIISRYLKYNWHIYTFAMIISSFLSLCCLISPYPQIPFSLPQSLSPCFLSSFFYFAVSSVMKTYLIRLFPN